MKRRRLVHIARALGVGLCIFDLPPRLLAIPTTWIGGTGTWADGGNIAFWNPADEPDPEDEAIFNTANTVTLGSANNVVAVTMSGGATLSTNGFSLLVDGPVTLSNTTTTLIAGGASSTLNADRIILNSGAVVNLAGGTIIIDQVGGNGLIDINTGGTLVGTGTISLTDVLTTTSSLIVNDGIISARSDPVIPFTAPPVGTLLINATSPNARINLDGTGAGGSVNVYQNQALKLNITLSDPFTGNINLFHNSTLDITAPWEMDFGVMLVATGAVLASGPNPAIAADTAYVAGGTMTMSGGNITVLDSDGALQFDAPLNQTGGSINSSGRVIINSNSRLGPGGIMGGTGSLTIKNGGTLLVDGGGTVGLDLRNEGTLNPTGKTTIGQISLKSLAQTATGKTYIQLGGPAPADSDRIVIDGSADFAGELRIGRINSLLITPGDAFTPITYSSHSGSLSLINDTGVAGLTFLGSYNSTSLTITAAALFGGDADLNGRVDLRDLVALATHWQTSANWFGGDFDGNGLVNSADLGILAVNWQAGANAASLSEAASGLGLPAASVPEPSQILAAMAVLVVLPKFRRR